MVSYVEQAILRVKDESTGPIKKINRELASLFKTARAGRDIKVDIKGLGAAEREVKSLGAAIRALPSRRSLTLDVKGVKEAKSDLKSLDGRNINARLRINGLTEALRGVRELRQELTGLNGTARVKVDLPKPPADDEVRPRNLNPRRRFPGNIGAEVSMDLGQEVAQALREVTRAALQAAVEMERVATKLRSIPLTEEERANVTARAQAASTANQTISEARATDIAADVQLNLEGADKKTIDSVTALLIQAEAAAKQVLPEGQARQATATSVKALNLSGVADNPALAKNVIDGVVESAVLLGETFSPEKLLTGFRTSGSLGAMAQQGSDAIASFAAAIDDAGTQAGTGLKRLKQVLSTPLESAGEGGGVAKGTVQTLINSGVRGEKGLTPEQAEAAFSDPFKFIIDTIKPLLSPEAQSGDNAALLENEVKALGFLGTDLRFIVSQIQNQDEIERLRKQVQAFDLAKVQEEAAKNLTTQLDAVAVQFQNVTNDVLVPLMATLAPAAEALAGWLNGLANSEGALSSFAKAAIVAGAPLLQLAAMNIDTVALGVAGLRLNSSAAALTRAAAALSGAAGADAAAPGAGGKGKGRTRLSGLAGGVAGGVLGGIAGSAIGDTIGGDTGAIAGGTIGSLAGAFGLLSKNTIGAANALDLVYNAGVKASTIWDEAQKRAGSEGNANEEFKNIIDETKAANNRAVENILPSFLSGLFKSQDQIDKEAPGKRVDEDIATLQGIGIEIGRFNDALAMAQQRVADMQAGEKETGRADPRLPEAEADVANLQAQIKASVDLATSTVGSDILDSGNQFTQSFGSVISSVTQSLGATVNTVPPILETAFSSGAAAVGAAITNALAAGVNVNVSGSVTQESGRETPRLNTGAETPF